MTDSTLFLEGIGTILKLVFGPIDPLGDSINEVDNYLWLHCEANSTIIDPCQGDYTSPYQTWSCGIFSDNHYTLSNCTDSTPGGEFFNCITDALTARCHDDKIDDIIPLSVLILLAFIILCGLLCCCKYRAQHTKKVNYEPISDPENSTPTNTN